MTAPARLAALLIPNPAFAALLARGLEAGGFRVGQFESSDALVTFLRIAPTETVILDADQHPVATAELARALRANPRLINPSFSIIALTRATAPLHRSLLTAVADSVLEKPVPPKTLLATIDDLSPDRFGPARAVVGMRAVPAVVPTDRYDNVIPLFGRRS